MSLYLQDTRGTNPPNLSPGQTCFSTLCVLTFVCSGEFEPAVYSGPTVTVLSSSITSTQFSATLQISNATTWTNNGALDVNSANAGVIWAYTTQPPNDPSNPDSDFQQHQTMGTFTINMKAAQAEQGTGSSGGTPSTPTGTQGSGTTGSTAGVVAPTITGDLSPDGTGGLSYREKVCLPGSGFIFSLPPGNKWLIGVGDCSSWSDHGNFFCDFVSSWSSHHQISRSLSSCPDKITLYNSDIHIPFRFSIIWIGNLYLNRPTIHQLPYSPPLSSPLTMYRSKIRYDHNRPALRPTRIRLLPPPPFHP